jgi:hypothetical protein
MKGIAQEAMETMAETKTEATKGDQQAIRRLARQQTAGHTHSAEPPASTTGGSRDILNVKA